VLTTVRSESLDLLGFFHRFCLFLMAYFAFFLRLSNRNGEIAFGGSLTEGSSLAVHKGMSAETFGC
jgi:hypothetical protein